jgi:hydrogenase/urease accessory protein HupE
MIRYLLFLLIICTAWTAPSPARADDFRPAYLQVTQKGPTRFDVLWKVPALSEDALLIVRPQFPPGTVNASAQRNSFADGIAVQRWSIEVPGGLEGKTIGFPGLSGTRIDVLARLERADGSVQLERILAVDPQFEVEASPGPFEVIQTYTVLGIEHILLGFDHLCFVLALVLIVRGARRLIWTVTAFTLAHSITLALATLDLIRVPGPPVEATIALSIVFVANEIIQQQRGREGLASKRPWLVAFAFGLLHGLGFAGALAEIGLPANAIPLALLFFNVGVEIGQLFVVVLAFGVYRVLARWPQTVMARAPALYAIGAIAAYWSFGRIVGVVG